MIVVILILAVVLTILITKVMNRNTFGTTGAYVKRFFTVFMVCLFVIGAIFMGLGLI